jgi:UDP-N-acetylmuramoyl-L-alanyl-D-glutamate--2,6-diaminopimelate ligase
MGTAGMYGNIDLESFPKTELTSPNSLHLHWALSTLKSRACTHVALEASSHGLDQRRMDCLDLAAAGYTNLTHEHLDYHKNMDAYFEAKCRLFTDLLPEGSGAVLNADDFRYPSLLAKCREHGHRIISYGRQSHDIQLLNIDLNEDGQELELRVFGRHYKTPLPLVGAIQSYNVMCAIGLAIASGSSEEEVMKALPYLKSVPGRFEWVGTLKNKTKVFVDYAHTPDALETLLTSIRPHVKGIIHLVFGCGGDRDTKKRPMMGELANKLAEKVYITDDNPRSEVPSAIRKEIHATCRAAIEIGDRREAIMTALAKCSDHDVCIIAGKGHEQGQIIGTDVLPFDDRLVAQEEILRLKGILA